MKKFEIRPAGLLLRGLRICANIDSCEFPTALLLTINVFLLLCAYYLIKPVGEAFILAGKGAEIKSYLSAGQAVLLIGVIRLYSTVSSRVPRDKLIRGITAFFISNLVVFYALSLLKVPLGTLGIVFYVWMGIFNLLIVAQFWAFANDIYSSDEGNRIFPMLAFGASFGAFFGSLISKWLMTFLGLNQMLLVAVAILGLCIILVMVIHEIDIKNSWDKIIKIKGECTLKDIEVVKPLRSGGGFRLVFKKRYLLYIACFVLFVNFINTNGEYILGKVAREHVRTSIGETGASSLDEAQEIGHFYANFFLWVSLGSLVIQFFLVSRIFNWVGVGGALLFLPVIALGGYLAISFGAGLLLVRWTKIVENSTNYSLNNTAKNALFLVTSREDKYKAQSAINTLFWRAGDVLSAVMVYFGTTYLSFRTESFALMNVIAASLCIILGIIIIREREKNWGPGST